MSDLERLAEGVFSFPAPLELGGAHDMMCEAHCIMLGHAENRDGLKSQRRTCGWSVLASYTPRRRELAEPTDDNGI